MKTYILALLVGTLIANTGCASYMVYKESAKRVGMRKAVATDDSVAIRNIRGGNRPQESGIEVTVGEALLERPGLQLGALGADALVGYLGYRGVEEISGSGSDEKGSASENTSGENTTVVQGDGNTVTITGSGGTGAENPFIAPQ